LKKRDSDCHAFSIVLQRPIDGVSVEIPIFYNLKNCGTFIDSIHAETEHSDFCLCCRLKFLIMNFFSEINILRLAMISVFIEK
jgi:hypothetical protein